MKIFDGVNVNTAALSPTWQGVVGVAMLFVNSLIEADKVRQEREAEEQKQQVTLGDVMDQAGLKIPGLHDALTNLMGGTDEARQAATMIVNTPDPGKLLREFAQGVGPGLAANGPIVTPPPAAPPATPKLATFRPEFTREGLEAAASAAASQPRPKLATFRPEFTSEGLEAAASAAASGPRPKLATFRPEFTSEGLEAAAKAAKAVSTPAANPPSRTPTIAEALEAELNVVARRMDANNAELDSRWRCAEADLALLREELRELRASKDRPTLFVVPSNAEETGLHDDAVAVLHVRVADDSTADVLAVSGPELQRVADPDEHTPAATAQDTPAATAQATPETEPSDFVASSDGGATSSALTDNESAPPLEEDANQPRSRVATSTGGAPPEADLARSIALLGAFSARVERDHAKQLERVQSVESEISVLRALIAREREAGSAASHG